MPNKRARLASRNALENSETPRRASGNTAVPSNSTTKGPARRPTPEHIGKIVVKDTIHTYYRPTTCKDTLVRSIRDLAIDVKHALKNDQSRNSRFALTISLNNKSNLQDTPCDQFHIKLPNEKVWWNDVDTTDIEYHLLEALLTTVYDQDGYQYYKLRVVIDDFITSDIKCLLDEMNEEWENEREDYKRARIRQLQEHQMEQANQERVERIENVDDDDEIEIIMEVPSKKNK